MRNIQRLFGVIDNSLFMTTGHLDYDRLTTAITRLAYRVHDTEEEIDWHIGEFGDCCLDELIVGAYWHFTEWHGGQGSDTYAALCALGNVFSPSMGGVEEDNEAYIALNAMAEERFGITNLDVQEALEDYPNTNKHDSQE